MKINFDDKSYFELVESKNGHKVYISIGSRQKDNPLELIVNTVEIEKKDFYNAVKSVLGPTILDQIKEN